MFSRVILPLARHQQRVLPENIRRAVAVESEVHLCRPDQLRQLIDAEDVFVTVVAQKLVGLFLGLLLDSPFFDLLPSNDVLHVEKSSTEETAGAAARI